MFHWHQERPFLLTHKLSKGSFFGWMYSSELLLGWQFRHVCLLCRISSGVSTGHQPGDLVQPLSYTSCPSHKSIRKLSGTAVKCWPAQCLAQSSVNTPAQWLCCVRLCSPVGCRVPASPVLLCPGGCLWSCLLHRGCRLTGLFCPLLLSPRKHARSTASA